jgi:Flp pilus assembly pilin Flp
MFAKLWNDECGNVAVEYLFLLSIVGLGMVVGFSNLETAIKAEYSELANAILGLSQAYAVSTQTGCKSYKQGSNVTDSPQTLGFGVTTVAATSINVNACSGAQTP